MKHTCAIFDMDGTLLDSMPYWKNLGRDYLIARGIPVPEDLQKTLGALTLEEGAVYFREHLGVTESVEEIVNAINGMIADNYRFRIPAKPGVKEFLASLKEQGIRMGIATATYDYVAMPALERLGLLPYFEFVLDCRELGGKTSPAVYDAAAARLGGGRESAMVFEDAAYAIRTAHEAGYFVAAVQDATMVQSEDWIRSVADCYIEDYRTTDFRDRIN